MKTRVVVSIIFLIAIMVTFVMVSSSDLKQVPCQEVVAQSVWDGGTFFVEYRAEGQSVFISAPICFI